MISGIIPRASVVECGGKPWRDTAVASPMAFFGLTTFFRRSKAVSPMRGVLASLPTHPESHERNWFIHRLAQSLCSRVSKQHFRRARIHCTGSVFAGMKPSFAHQATMNCPVRPQPATQCTTTASRAA